MLTRLWRSLNNPIVCRLMRHNFSECRSLGRLWRTFDETEKDKKHVSDYEG